MVSHGAKGNLVKHVKAMITKNQVDLANTTTSNSNIAITLMFIKDCTTESRGILEIDTRLKSKFAWRS